MKLFYVFWNYLKFVRKQGSTAWLTLFYPLILILVVGIGLTIEASGRIPVAVYGDDPVLDIISAESGLAVTGTESLEELKAEVSAKRAVMGIAVSSSSSGKRIDIYLDSTKQAVASNLLLLVDRAVSEEKTRSGESLSAIQKKLAPTYTKLKDKRGEIANFSIELSALRQNLSDVRDELSDGRDALASYRAELTAYRTNLTSLDNYSAKLDSYDDELQTMYSDINYKEYQRNVMLSKLDTNIYKTGNYLVKVNNTLYYVSLAKGNVTPYTPGYNYLTYVEDELLALQSDLQDAQSDMQTLRNELYAISFSSIRANITSIRSDIANTSSDISSFRSLADAKIGNMLADINTTDAKLALAISELDSFDTKVAALQAKAVEFDTLMGAVLSPLSDFIGKKPDELLPPQIVSTSVFEGERWIDMFFPSIIGIDMLLACLLLPMIMKVRMREQGVELRMMRSKASSFSVVLGEVLANYAISMLQLLLILMMGIAFFGVHVNNPFGLLLAFVTLPVVFTSLGVLLSQAVNRSSTAFLLSLLIGIPMIFISGTIIPLEFLNPVIATVGMLLPLYVVIDFGEKLLFRSVPLFDVFVDMVYLSLFVMANTILAMVMYALRR